MRRSRPPRAEKYPVCAFPRDTPAWVIAPLSGYPYGTDEIGQKGHSLLEVEPFKKYR